MSAATAAASLGSSGCCRRVGFGPAGDSADQLDVGRGRRCPRAYRGPRADRRGPRDEVGQGDDLRGGPVVADQGDHPGSREPAREPQQVVGRGAGERVDGLRRIAHDADVVAFPEPEVQEPLLEGVDVLVLVDDEVAVLAADGPGDLLPLGEDPRGEEQHVLEVDDAPLGLALLVGLEQPRHLPQVDARRVTARRPGVRRIRLRGEQGDLGPLDLGGEVADGGPVELQPQPRGRLGDDRRLVGEDLGSGTPHGLRPEVVQLAKGRGVEGPGLDAPDPERRGGGCASPRRRGR